MPKKDKLHEHIAGKEVPASMRPMLLYDARTDTEGSMLAEILEKEGIPVLVESSSKGGLQAYMGYSMYGVSVYVDECDYARAKEILLGIVPGSGGE